MAMATRLSADAYRFFSVSNRVEVASTKARVERFPMRRKEL